MNVHTLFFSAAPAWHFLNMFLVFQAGTRTGTTSEVPEGEEAPPGPPPAASPDLFRG